MKNMLKSVRSYKRSSILTALFAGLEVVMEIIIPFLMADIIDKGIYAGNMPQLMKLGIWMVVFVVLGLIFGLLSGTNAATASAGFAKNLRGDMYKQIQGFSFANIDKFSAASLVTRLTTDVTNVQLAYMMVIRVAVRAPAMLIFSLLMAFTINVQLACLFLLMIPILGGGLGLLIWKAHPYFTKVFHLYDDLNGVVQENLSGIRVVKSYVREDFERSKFQGVSTALYKVYRKAESLMALNAPLMQLVVYVCMLLISWLGARTIVLSGGTALSTGQLTSLISYAMQILTALMMLSTVVVLITIAQSSGERIVEVLNETSDIVSPEHAAKEVKDGSIIFEHVDFGYGKAALTLRDVNLSIPSGATVGIIGGTGSGKSSLVQLIARLYDISSGSLRVGGVEVRDYDLDSLRDAVAMVLQKNVLFSGSIKENLRWGDVNASDKQLVHACKLAQADEFISQLSNGYDTYLEQGGTNLSGGQKQRLCIARALLKHPKILILDDSTSAVDTKTDALIRKSFAEEIPDVTKIIIAQRISSVESADMIIVMDGEQIDAVGTHESLLKDSSIYREVYQSQQKGGESNEEK